MSTIENLDKTNLMKSMGNYDETLYLRSLARFLALPFYFRFFFFSIVRDASHDYWQQGQHEPLTHTHRHHCLQNWLQRFFVRYNIQDNTIPLAIATYFVQFVSTTSFCRTFERETRPTEKKREVARNAPTWVQYNHAYLVVCQAIKLKQIDYICWTYDGIETVCCNIWHVLRLRPPSFYILVSFFINFFKAFSLIFGASNK